MREMGRSSGRLVYLDALRGLGAMTVVLHHLHAAGKLGPVLAAALPISVVTLLHHAGLGYELFFVISGFVMAWVLRDVTVTRAYALRFLARRAARLDPPYWASIALVLVCIALSNALITDRVAEMPDAAQVAANMFYLHDLVGERAVQDPYWTLCLEVQLYVFFLAYLAGVQAFTRRARALGWREGLAFERAAMLLMAFASVVPRQDFIDGGRRTFVPWLFLFLMGVATCWLVERRIPVWLWASFLAFNMLRCGWLEDWRPVVSGFAAISILVGARRDALHRWLGSRWIQYLGRISYSLYLTHGLVGGHLMSIGYRITGNHHGAAIFWLVAAIFCSILAAHALHVLVEQPCVEYARRIPLFQRATIREPAAERTAQVPAHAPRHEGEPALQDAA